MKRKHLKMAWRGGFAHGRGNTKAAILACAPFKPDIIELDIRKSKDAVIYCYHGFIPLAYFLRFFKYRFIEKWLRAETLEELISAIPKGAIAYCDMKQKNISPSEFRKTFKGFHGEVWIAAYSLNYIAKLKRSLKGRFRFVYNFGLFHFARSIKKAKAAGVDIVQVFPWQWKPKYLKKIKKLGMAYGVCSFLIGQKRTVNVSKKLEPIYIRYADLKKLN